MERPQKLIGQPPAKHPARTAAGRFEEAKINWLWLNVPLATVIFGAVTGIPLWMVIKHPDTGPDAAAMAPAARPMLAQPQFT